MVGVSFLSYLLGEKSFFHFFKHVNLLSGKGKSYLQKVSPPPPFFTVSGRAKGRERIDFDRCARQRLQRIPLRASLFYQKFFEIQTQPRLPSLSDVAK